MPPVRHRSARTAALAAALAAGLGVATLQGPPATAAPPREPSAIRIDTAAAEAQCDMSFPGSKGSRRAAELMAGRVNLGQYGTFRLAADPTWRPVSSLDSSGKGHMHSLHYLLPLLRNGVRTGNGAMVSRFYAVLRDWARDNRPGAASSRYAWGPPIYEGFRAQVLVCAAAGPRGGAPWLARTLLLHGKMLSSSSRYEGANNASLHQSMGLYALGETLRRPKWRQVAASRMNSLVERLVYPDGSDEEGALSYAINNYRWFRQAAERLRRGGDPVPANFSRVDQIPAFVARATRPDGRIEALGDTSPVALKAPAWAGTAAEYAATGGTVGTPPADAFSYFGGGYVFGRSGWGQSRPYADETYFSIRAGATRFIPHAHDDAGSLTLYAHGSPLLVDTGQWRYLYGPIRSFIVSRAAHNVVVVNGAARSDQGRPTVSAGTVNGLDIATVVDRGYRGVTITRTVAYDRAEDVLVVWDRLDADRKVRASQQWGLHRSKDVTLEADGAHTTGPGANVSMLFTSGGAPLDVAKGDRNPMRGWSSESYGELSPAPSVRATQSGTSLSWLTVIAPRSADVPASAVSATAAVSSSAASVSLTTPSGSALVSLDGSGGSRSAAAPVPPALTASESIVLAGTQTTLRARGLPPRQDVTLTAQAPGGAEQPVATSTATAAGTADFRVPVSATADFRVSASSGASAPVPVTAAVAPAPPQAVTAAPAGRGKVSVTWTPPGDTGGAPLTRYIVRIKGQRVVLPPDATSTVLSGVVAGSRSVRVRASNQVADSAWAAVPVEVAPYPSIAGAQTARKGTAVLLTLRGLRPGQKPDVTLSSGKAARVTRISKATDVGAATLRLVVRRTVRVTVTSGGVPSAPHRIRVPRR